MRRVPESETHSAVNEIGSPERAFQTGARDCHFDGRWAIVRMSAYPRLAAAEAFQTIKVILRLDFETSALRKIGKTNASRQFRLKACLERVLQIVMRRGGEHIHPCLSLSVVAFRRLFLTALISVRSLPQEDGAPRNYFSANQARKQPVRRHILPI